MPLLLNATTTSATVDGVSSLIVILLKQYQRELPIGFIASRLGRSINDITIHLDELENNHIIKKFNDKIILNLE